VAAALAKRREALEALEEEGGRAAARGVGVGVGFEVGVE
jgi:hypothetical protein